MTIHLIRHATAGDRHRWDGDDLDRPLDTRGRGQADAIAVRLADAPIRAIWSSLAVRCIDTVAPLAEATGLEVRTSRALTEGADWSQVIDLLDDEAAGAGDVAFCSHGDLIPEALNHLLRRGMEITGPRGCAKASIWSLETRGSEVVRAVYLAAP